MDADDPTTPRQDPERERIPLERKISLKFKEFRGFITEYSANISLGGMFITTEAPQPPGSVFDFEFRLADDDFQIIHGIGEVMWARSEPAGPDRPTGMGVRFLHLGDGSRDLIRRMVDEHERSGGTPFDLESQAPHRVQEGTGGGTETRGTPAVPAAELAETASLDLPEEEGHGAPDRPAGDEEYGSPVDPTPGETEPSPIAPETDAPDVPYRRFDAAMASLRRSRAREAGAAEDLPPGFDEVRAALRAEDAGAVDEAGTTPPTIEPLPHTPVEPAPDAGYDAARPPSRGAIEPPGPRGARAESRGEGRRGSRWILWALAGLGVVVAISHILVPGGLPAVPAALGWSGPEAGSEPEPEAIDTEADPTDGVSTTAGPVEETASPEARIVEVPGPLPADPGTEPADGELSPRSATAETAAPPAVPAETTTSSPFTRLENVEWRVEGGRTMVELSLDGSVPEGRYSNFRLDGGSPREVLRLQGVSEPYSPSSLSVRGGQVERIRLGFHRRPGGDELHVVLDLTGPGVRITDLETSGSRIRLVLGTP